MKFKLILLFVVFFLGSLLITLPADKLVNFIPTSTPIEVVSVSGALSEGKALQVIYNKQFQFKNIDWKMDWLALARLKLKLNVEFNNGPQKVSGKGFILFGFSGVSIENFMLDISMAELLSYAEINIPAEVSGDLSLVVNNATEGDPYCQELDGYLVWRNARVDSEIGEVDLDSAHVDLTCVDGQIEADLEQDSDQLTTRAKIILQDKGIYEIQGLLKPGDNLDPSIKDTLSWVGVKNESGDTTFKFKAKL